MARITADDTRAWIEVIAALDTHNRGCSLGEWATVHLQGPWAAPERRWHASITPTGSTVHGETMGAALRGALQQWKEAKP